MKPTTWMLAVTSMALAPLAAAVHAQPAPETCRTGYVWREAFPGDLVCVTPETRAQAARDNREAHARREPGGGPYGSERVVRVTSGEPRGPRIASA